MSERDRKKRLDTLLRVRRIEEDQAKGELLRANAATQAAYGNLDACLASYDERTATPVSGDVDTFRRALALSVSAAAMVRGAERGIEAAEEEAATARDGVRRARVRTQGLERLVSRVEAAAFAEVLASDQRTAEESRAGRFTKGRR